MASLNPALRDFWTTPARNRILYGGRSSSKSHDAAGFAIFLAQYTQIRVLCVRQFQNKISESVYTLLKMKIEAFGLKDKFEVTKNSIICTTTGSEFLFYGIQRNLDEIKSIEGVDLLWIEEAHNLTSDQWEVLEPTIRAEGSQIWIIFNPRFANDFVYRRFVTNPPPDTIVRKINYDENPFLSDTMLKVIETARADDPEEFAHIYLGEPRDTDDNAVIKRRWLQSAIDAHLTVEPQGGAWGGPVVVGYDVADSGNDSNAAAVLKGNILVGLDEWKGNEDELRESAMRVKTLAEQFGAVTIGYDSIGVGAGTGSHLNGLGWRKHFRFNAGGKVVKPKQRYGMSQIPNADFFANIKAQMWWNVADRLRNTHLAVTKGREFKAHEMLSLSSKCDSRALDKLIDELSTPFRDFDEAGKVKVESKKSLAKRDIVSPNLADSFIIANARSFVSSFNIADML